MNTITDRDFNILITSSGRRVQLLRFFQQALENLRLRGKVVALDMDPVWSSAAREADVAFQSPHAKDPAYRQFLVELVRRENIRLIVPMIDTELIALTQLCDSLGELNCRVVVCDLQLIRICRDKRLSASWFRDLGFETPAFMTKEKLSFPFFAKPYDGSLSKGARAVLTPDMMSNDLLADKKLLFMEYCSPEKFDEVTVDAYYDVRGELRCLVPRKRLEVRGGEISKGVALKGRTYRYLREKLHTVEGARGCLTYQFFVSKAEDRWLASELNPRFGGGFPLTYATGANYPEWLIREYLLHEEIPFFEDWTDRTAMVRFDSEIIFTLPDES